MKYIFTITTGFFFVAISIAQLPHKVEADKIVGIVGDKIILKSDVYSEISDKRRRVPTEGRFPAAIQREDDSRTHDQINRGRC